jgi:hypothetical protein
MIGSDMRYNRLSKYISNWRIIATSILFLFATLVAAPMNNVSAAAADNQKRVFDAGISQYNVSNDCISSTTTAGSCAKLAEIRAEMASGMTEEQKVKLYSFAVSEGKTGGAGFQAQIETALNRAYTWHSGDLQALLNNTAYYQDYCSASKNCNATISANRADLDSIFERVLGGSNMVNFADGNGSCLNEWSPDGQECTTKRIGTAGSMVINTEEDYEARGIRCGMLGAEEECSKHFPPLQSGVEYYVLHSPDRMQDIIDACGSGGGLSSSPSSGYNGGDVCDNSTGGEGVITNIDQYEAYNQGDPAWGSTYLSLCTQSDGRTIQAAGCGISGMAAIVTSLTGRKVTPSVVVEEMEAANINYCTMSDTDAVNRIAEFYGLAADGAHSTRTDGDKEAIIQALKNGKRVIAAGAYGPFTSGGHYIAFMGIDSDGNWLVADSGFQPIKTTTTADSVMSHVGYYHIISKL